MYVKTLGVFFYPKSKLTIEVELPQPCGLGADVGIEGIERELDHQTAALEDTEEGKEMKQIVDSDKKKDDGGDIKYVELKETKDIKKAKEETTGMAGKQAQMNESNAFICESRKLRSETSGLSISCLLKLDLVNSKPNSTLISVGDPSKGTGDTQYQLIAENKSTLVLSIHDSKSTIARQPILLPAVGFPY
eukprot:111034-Amorphochlora_amoeboformis.AAC.1